MRDTSVKSSSPNGGRVLNRREFLVAAAAVVPATGPITRGGVTDKWLGDYPNLLADLSANSGNNAMARDPEFTADFLKRHQEASLRQRLQLQRRPRWERQPEQQPGGGTTGGKVRGTRDLEPAEAVDLGRDLPENRLGQHAHAAADSGVAGRRLETGRQLAGRL
jgi:hypothetical protein